MIALDHNHEQENESIKGDGGAVGLTESVSALRRWMIAGPEVSRVVKEFEDTFLDTNNSDTHHHEQASGVQKTFAEDVKSLVSVIDDMGNPFTEDSGARDGSLKDFFRHDNSVFPPSLSSMGQLRSTGKKSDILNSQEDCRC